MREFTLEHYEDKLNHQVIHMDQAVCYCPEFRASHMLHDYPSRRLQLARAVFKDEMAPNDYIAGLVTPGRALAELWRKPRGFDRRHDPQP